MRIRHALKSLRRRQEFLKTRLKDRQNATDRSYDQGEVAALDIAIRCIEMAISYGVTALTNYGEPLFEDQTMNEPGEVGHHPGRARRIDESTKKSGA